MIVEVEVLLYNGIWPSNNKAQKSFILHIKVGYKLINNRSSDF